MKAKAKTEMKGQAGSSSACASACSLVGVRVELLRRFEDHRGWLTELFRLDVLDAAGMSEARPVMSYLSMTRPGVARGPHEHRDQTDFFVFLGPSDFEVTLWDNRPGSPTMGRREVFVLGADRPASLIVPPGVVHAYRNVGEMDGWVINFPNRLFKGAGRKEPVDEIRHEDNPDSSYRLQVSGSGSPNHEP